MAEETRLYCWGVSNCTQLGSSSPGRDLTEPVKLTRPTYNDQITGNIVQVASGLEHTLFLTSEGEVFACGNGEVGQLAMDLPTSSKQILKPECVSKLKCHIVKAIAAGDQHSVAVTSFGEVYCWGDNTFGQTGIFEKAGGYVSFPVRVKALNNVKVTQVACGANHTLVLAADGSVHAWGLNKNGQLGMKIQDNVPRPQLVESLRGVPIVQVCCGGQMSACVSRFGYLLTWGSNRHGQLGRTLMVNIKVKGSTRESVEVLYTPIPAAVPHLERYSVPIVYVAVGSNNVAALDKEGKLWTFGLHSSGECGHGGSTVVPASSVVNPRTVEDLWGSRVVQVECGRKHTLVVTTKQVYSFGEGSCGQLGIEELPRKGFVTSPRPVQPTWRHADTPSRLADASVQTTGDVNTSQSSLMEVDQETSIDTSPVHVKQIFCGGDSSFLVTTSEPSLCLDRTTVSRGPPPPPALAATHSLLAEDAAHQAESVPVMLPSASLIEVEGAVPAAPSPPPAPVWPLPVYELQLAHLQYMVNLKPHDRIEDDLFSYMETAIGSPACWNQSFVAPIRERDPEHHYIDLEAAEEYMETLTKIHRDTVKNMVFRSIEKAVSELPKTGVTGEFSRVYLLLPLTPPFEDPSNFVTIHGPFANHCGPSTVGQLRNWLYHMPLRVLKKLVLRFKAVLHYFLKQLDTQLVSVPPMLDCICSFLRNLRDINRLRESQLAPEVFHVGEIFEKVKLSSDYHNWHLRQQSLNLGIPGLGTTYFCDYPFLFNALCKNMILRVDSIMRMSDAMRSVPMSNINLLSSFNLSSILPVTFNQSETYFKLRVRRTHIVEDTVRELGNAVPRDLKLPLQVEFIGEDAQDDGGVRKEFFKLLMPKLLSLDYGMFVEFEDSRHIWFSENFYDDSFSQMYFVVGQLCGLAIYNNIIVNLPFPLPLYKKLLYRNVTLEDFSLLSPTIARNLRSLLEYEGDDFEEVFFLNFSLDRNLLGEVMNVPLKEDGQNIPVTNKNKKEYVDMVVDYYLNTGISKPYKNFEAGFKSVCQSDIMRLFEPFELMALVVGNEDYDWVEFRNNTTYNGIYYDKHETILLFWKVFEEMSLADKKKFLFFLTGCDRVPLLGMKTIQMVVEPTKDTNHLPAAHTCAQQLDLPQYKTEERLRYQLLNAIQYCEGFGMI